VLGAKRAEGLGDVLFELSGLFVILLDDFVSIMEHVCDYLRTISFLFVCWTS